MKVREVNRAYGRLHAALDGIHSGTWRIEIKDTEIGLESYRLALSRMTTLELATVTLKHSNEKPTYGGSSELLVHRDKGDA